MKHLNVRTQKGLATVELAIAATVFFVVMFGVIEVSRLMYTLNVLDEVTRRGARLASVCPVTENAKVKNLAILEGRLVNGLGVEHVQLEYLNAAGNIIADPVAQFIDIVYVRVRITGYRHQMLIPLLFPEIVPSEYSTTVLAESLGISPPGTGTTSC